MNTMDAAAVGNVIVDAHGQRAGALRHQSDVTAQFGHLAGAGGNDVLLAKVHLAVYLHTLYGVYQAIEGAQQRGFAAA